MRRGMARTGVFENLRCVTVGEKGVGLEIFIHFDEMKITARVFACAGSPRFAVANNASAGCKQICLGKRSESKNHAGGITARIGNQTSCGNFARIKLGNAVDRFRKPIGMGRGELVPGGESFRLAKTKCAAQINNAETSLD